VRGSGCALYTSNAGKPSADLYTGKGKRVNKLCHKRKTIKGEYAKKKHIHLLRP